MENSKLEEALVLSNSMGGDEDRFVNLFTKWKLNKLSEDRTELLDYDHSITNPRWLIELYNVYSLIYIESNDFELASKAINQASKLMEEKNYEDLMPKVYNTKGVIHHRLNQLDLAVDTYQEALKYLNRQSGEKFKKMTIPILGNIASIEEHKGNFREALITFQDLKQRIYELEMTNYFPIIHNKIATCYRQLGKLNDALIEYETGLRISHQNHEISGQLVAIDGISRIHLLRGKFELAKSKLIDSQELWLQYSDERMIGQQLFTLSRVNIELGLFSEAHISLQKAIEIYENNDTPYMLAGVFLHYIRVQIYTGRTKEQEVTLLRLEKIANDNKDIPLIQYIFLTARGLVHFHRRTLESMLESKKDFEKVVEATDAEFIFWIICNMHLIEFYMIEFRIFNRVSSLNTLVSRIKSQITTAKLEQNSYILARTYLLQARLEMIQRKFDRAVSQINLASQISQEDEMPLIIDEIQVLKKEIEEIKNSVNLLDTQKDTGENEGQEMEEMVLNWNSPIMKDFMDIALHPIRFKILKLLDKEQKIFRSELRDRLLIPPGSMERHLKKLEEDKLIISKIHLSDGRPQSIIMITAEASIAITKLSQ